MNYEVLISQKAKKELSKLPNDIYNRFKNVINNLENNPRPRNCLKLSGRYAWRIRVGDYRVIYEINDFEKK